MSKRNSKFKLPPRLFKMPRLDVSIQRGNTSKRILNNNSAEKFKNDVKKPAVPVIDLLLDDDDDEDLLFASQMVENNENKNINTEVIDTQSFNINIFGSTVASSTQIQPPKFCTPNLFEEDSCDFELDTDLLNVINKNGCNNKQNYNSKKSAIQVFKLPEQNNTATNSLMDDVMPTNTNATTSYNNDAIQIDQFAEMLVFESANQHNKIKSPNFFSTPNLFEDEDSCDFELDRDLLNVINKNSCNKQNYNLKNFDINQSEKNYTEKNNFPINAATTSKQPISLRSSFKGYESDAIQVNQLVQRLDILHDESKKQNQQIYQLNEKLLTKEGEVSVLRFEQRQLKQQIDTLRIQKITEADVIKKDWQDRIHELERNLKEKTVELNLTNNEIIKLKQTLLDDNSKIEIKNNYKSIGMLYRLNCRNLPQILNKNIELSIDTLFKKTHQNNTLLDKYYQQELDEICNLLGEIQFNPEKLKNYHSKDILYKEIVESTARALAALSKYIASLKQLKIIQNVSVKSKFDIIEKSEFNQICYLHKIDTKMCIYQPNELFPNEKMIPLRRYIAALGLICENLTNIKLTITTQINNSNILLDKLMELLKNSSNHFGILESIAFLLSSLAKINKIKPYLNLLKNLIFLKPNIRILAEISNCLRIISNNEDIETLTLLCQKSEGYLCLLNDTRKKIRVQRNTSCILQIYGLILESAYKQNKSQNENEWKLLLMTCSNHIRFLRNCFAKYACFSKNTNCFCYMQICTSFVILFHIFLKHCIENPEFMYVQSVRTICKIGSLLIFEIFYTNYRKCILQKGAVKQRLYITCEWLNENFDNLELGKEYQIAIQRIRSSSIFADSNVNNDENQPMCREKGNIILRNVFDNNSFI